MKIKLIAVGKVKDKHLAAKVDDYARRITRYAKLQQVEIKDSTPEKEGKRIEALLQESSGWKMVLSEEGQAYSSAQFAQRIEAIESDLVFVIGGPEGLSDEVKKNANELLSLSPMTFVHEMARMVLLEQTYRAYTILNNGKYHK